jgi:YD repeat-containing protein
VLQTKNEVDTTYTYSATGHLDSTATGGQTESFTYDAAGLLRTNVRGTSTDTFTYTPSNLQETAQMAVGGQTTYWYDADGQRVRKVFGSEVGSTYYLRGPLGVLSEFPPPPAYQPRGLWRDLAEALRAKAGRGRTVSPGGPWTTSTGPAA